MPYVENQGVRIHYRVVGDGPPLVLQHGSSMRSALWDFCGYVDALKDNYRLVLIDARGHGESDKPHDRAAYRWPISVMDVIAVLDALELRQATFWGYSWGGAVGFGLTKLAPNRVTALIVGGSHAEATDFGTRLRGEDGRDPEAFVAAYEKNILGERMPEEGRARVLASDTQALAAFMQDRPSYEDLLPNLRTSCLVYAGDKDQAFAKAQATARKIPHAVFVSLEGLNHAGAFMHSDRIVPHVTDFLEAQRYPPRI